MAWKDCALCWFVFLIGARISSWTISSEEGLLLSLVLNKTGPGLPVTSILAPVFENLGQNTGHWPAPAQLRSWPQMARRNYCQFHVDGREEICNPRLSKVKNKPNRQQQKLTDVSVRIGVGGFFSTGPFTISKSKFPALHRLKGEKLDQKIVDRNVSCKCFSGPPIVKTKAKGHYFVSWVRVPPDLALMVKC